MSFDLRQDSQLPRLAQIPRRGTHAASLLLSVPGACVPLGSRMGMDGTGLGALWGRGGSITPASRVQPLHWSKGGWGWSGRKGVGDGAASGGLIAAKDMG